MADAHGLRHARGSARQLEERDVFGFWLREVDHVGVALGRRERLAVSLAGSRAGVLVGDQVAAGERREQAGDPGAVRVQAAERARRREAAGQRAAQHRGDELLDEGAAVGQLQEHGVAGADAALFTHRHGDRSRAAHEFGVAPAEANSTAAVVLDELGVVPGLHRREDVDRGPHHARSPPAAKTPGQSSCCGGRPSAPALSPSGRVANRREPHSHCSG